MSTINANDILRPLAQLVAENPESDPAKLAIWYGPPLTDEMVATAEATLGVKLPEAYLDLLRQINGGFTRFDLLSHPNLPEEAADFTTLPGIGYDVGLDGAHGSNYMVEEWEYPEGLVYLSGDGHTAFCLDYRTCGPQGDPGIAWVDVEIDAEDVYDIAPTVGEFLQFLQNAPKDEK